MVSRYTLDAKRLKHYQVNVFTKDGTQFGRQSNPTGHNIIRELEDRLRTMSPGEKLVVEEVK